MKREKGVTAFKKELFPLVKGGGDPTKWNRDAGLQDGRGRAVS